MKTQFLSKEDGSIIVKGVLSEKIFEGNLWLLSSGAVAVGNGTSLDGILRVNPTFDIHAWISLNIGGDAEIFISKNPSLSDSGTPETFFNLNDSIGTSAMQYATAFITPTLTGTSPPMYRGFASGGSGKKSGGSQFDAGLEWEFAKNQVYYLAIKNISGAEQKIQMEMLYQAHFNGT